MIFKHFELALRLQAAVPWLELESAYAHVEAAQAASTEDIPTELLLGIAFVESRFDPTTVSRVEGQTRRTGRHPSTRPPARLNRRASLFCGPLQTYARSWSMCLDMRDLDVAYSAAAAEIGNWMRDRRVRGNVRRALAGHGCGNHGVLTGACNGYQGRVLSMERRFRSDAGDRRRTRQPAPNS